MVSLTFAQEDVDSVKSSAVLEDSSAIFTVDSIVYEIGDAFDDSKAYTKADSAVYRFLNWVHVESRESTIRNLLLFNQGETSSLHHLLETERFLRKQSFLSDAHLNLEKNNDQNVVRVKTSDNWTLSIPLVLNFVGDSVTWDNLIWGIGIQESNFLGLGQKARIFYESTKDRDMFQIAYGAPNFIFRHNQFDVLYSLNSDGYLAQWSLYKPFLSRSVNQWAYTLAGQLNSRTQTFYSSGDMPGEVELYDLPESIRSDKKKMKAIPKYNDYNDVPVMMVKDFRDDSLTYRVSRSFGGAQRKFFLAGTYDFCRRTAENGKILRSYFMDGDSAYVISEAEAETWVPERWDSRLGFYLMYSNLHYEKMVNYHNVKWTEDVDKGYTVKAAVSKNVEQLGADNNDFRFEFYTNMNLGRDAFHVNLNSDYSFYLDGTEMRDIYGKVKGEVLFHPSNQFSTVLSGWFDAYKNAANGYQLSLGGVEGFQGLPDHLYTGSARTYLQLEQRYFPNFELGTIAPVFTVFAGMGETAWDLMDINRKDLRYVLGLGLRLAETKSITRTINVLNVSFPLNGPRKKPAFTLTATASL